MQCPHCEFTSTELLCPQCGEQSEAADLNELSHLDYMETILRSWRHEGQVSRLRGLVATRLAELRPQAPQGRVGIAWGDAKASPDQPAVSSDEATALRDRPSVPPPPAAPPKRPPVPPPPAAAPEPPARAPREAKASAPGPGLVQPAGAPLAPPAARARPAMPPPPVRIARAVVPFISRYGLASIPYIGVVLIVVALSIGLYSVWSDIPPVLRLIIFLTATLVVFAGAYVLRVPAGLPTTAAAVGLIGGALIIVDGFTLGADLLGQDGAGLWLTISIASVASYAVVAQFQRDLPFGFLTVGAGGSTFVATLIVAGLEPQWVAGALTALCAGSLAAPPVLRVRLPHLAEALWWSARVALPVVMLGTLGWNRGLAPFPFMDEPASDYATGLVWWVGSATYYLSWLRTRLITLEHAAAWTIAVSYTLTTVLAAPSAAWIGPMLLPLAAAYLLYGRYARPWVLRTVPATPAPAGVPWPVPDFLRNLQPAFLVAHVAIALALAWPAQTVETRTVTLLFTTVLWAGSGYLFRRLTGLYEHLTVWTAVLVVATFEWTTPSAWLSLPIVGLGAAALAYEALIRPRILLIEDAARWTLAWVASESSRFSPALLVGHALPLLAVAWPWQTADSRYLTLAAVAVASAAAVRLYPARALAYEWIAVGLAAVAVVLALFETALAREWISVAVVGFGAALLLAARFDRGVLRPNRPPSLLEAPVEAAGALPYIPATFVASNVLLVAAVAWPWQTADSRIAALLIAVLAAVLAAGLFPRLYRGYEVAATALAVGGLAFALHEMQARSGLDADWAAMFFVPASVALLAFASLRPRLFRRLGVVGGTRFWTSPPAVAAIALAGAAAVAPWGDPGFNLGRVTGGYIVGAQAALVAFIGRRTLAHYAAAAVLTAAWAQTLGLAGVSLNDAAMWMLVPTAAFAIAGEAMQARRVRFGDAERPATVAGRRLPALASMPYLAAAYALSLAVLVLASYRLFVEGAARVEFMAAYVGVVALWVVSSYLRRWSIFLIAAAPLAVVPFVLASDHGFFVGLEFQRVDLAWNAAVLAAVYFGLGLAVDAARGHYSKGLHATAFVLIPWALVWAIPDRTVDVRVMAVAAAFFTASAVLTHAGRHPSFLWLAGRLFRPREGLAHRTFRSLFVYLTAATVPVLVLLAQSLVIGDLGAYGLTLALLAPAYLAAGLALRRFSPDYQIPLGFGALVMGAIAPMVAAPHEVHRIATLALGIGTFAAHAPAYREPRYLYLAAGLMPVLMGLVYDARGVGFRFYGLGLIGLAFATFAIGETLHRLRAARLPPVEGWRWAYAEPLAVVSMVFVAVGLAVAQPGQAEMIAAFSLAALFFLAPAWLYREPIFLYATAALLPVAYAVALNRAGLEDRLFGPAMIPGVALYVALSFLLGSGRALPRNARDAVAWLGGREAPFLMAAFVATVALPLVSADDRVVLSATLAASAAVYLYATWHFRSPLALHPAVWATLAALVALIFGLQPDISWARAATYVLPATVGLQLGAAFIWLREGQQPWGRLTLPVGHWSLPFQLAAVSAALISLPVTAFAHVEGTVVAFGLAATAAATAHWLRLRPFAWAAIALAAVGIVHAAAARDAALADGFALLALFGLALSLLLSLERAAQATLAPRGWLDRVRLWREPLAVSALMATAIALAGSAAVFTFADGAARRDELQPLIAAVAAAGLVGANLAWVFRRLEGAYLSVAALLVAGMLEMVFFEIDQPQLYTAPVGAYLLAIGLFEQQRGDRVLAFPFQVAGIVVLLGTTLLQGVGWQPLGLARFAYGSILLTEAAGVLLIGLYLRHRLSFFAGIGGMAAAMVVLVSDPVQAVWVTAWWVIVALIGALAVGGYAFFEWQRQQLTSTARQWLTLLDAWD